MAGSRDSDGIKRFEDPLGPRRGPAAPGSPPGGRDTSSRRLGRVWTVGLLVVLAVLAGPAYVVVSRGGDVIGECRHRAAEGDGFRDRAREFLSCSFTR